MATRALPYNPRPLAVLWVVLWQSLGGDGVGWAIVGWAFCQSEGSLVCTLQSMAHVLWSNQGLAFLVHFSPP